MKRRTFLTTLGAAFAAPGVPSVPAPAAPLVAQCPFSGALVAVPVAKRSSVGCIIATVKSRQAGYSGSFRVFDPLGDTPIYDMTIKDGLITGINTHESPEV